MDYSFLVLQELLSVHKNNRNTRNKREDTVIKESLSDVNSPSNSATDHILFGMVLLCRYIVPTVNTSVNTASAAISIHTAKKCVSVNE